MTTSIKGPPYICDYCNSEYKVFENYNRHYRGCEFFHKTRREREQDRQEYVSLPSQKEMFRLLQDLTLTCNQLKKEVQHLKHIVGSKRRKEVVDYLNQAPAPEYTFDQWIRSQTIEFHHLECVFETNLTEGLKRCIAESLNKETTPDATTAKGLLKYTQIPICAFEQRPNQFYIYDTSGSSTNWKRMEHDQFDRWISTLSHRFLQYFIEWQAEQLSRIPSEEEKTDIITYMIKVNGGLNPKTDKDRRISELKKWLFSKIQIPAGSLVEIVI